MGQQKDKFQAIADKYFVQIRGAHGEHTETNDHVYDISNKRRLGRSEVDLVQDMYNGVKAMIDAEKALMPRPQTPPEDMSKPNVGDFLKTPDDLKSLPRFPPGTNSALSKNLSKDVWDKCKDLKDAHGFTFKRAIFSGCKNVDSGIGVYAGSHDSYKTFSPLMNPIIE